MSLAKLDTRAMVAALAPLFGARVRPDEPLARHGTFGVGGPADAFVTIEREDEALALAQLAREHGWPLMLVGNGSNVLYADAGARGIVARMAIAEWSLEPLDEERTRLVAGAGVNLPKLVNDLATRGLSGLEWGAGVPGTIGGAVVSNAGAGGACMGDTLESARALFATAPAGPRVEELAASELELAYRHSRFRAARRVTFDAEGAPMAAPRAAIEPPEMIVGAAFVLRKDDPEAIRKRVKQHLVYRKETQPPQKSAGSVFKNPPDDYSGRLIEAARLKGHRFGQAEISAKHANFIVNRGGATAAEIVQLIGLARRTVRERFGVELELEVELRGEW